MRKKTETLLLSEWHHYIEAVRYSGRNTYRFYSRWYSFQRYLALFLIYIPQKEQAIFKNHLSSYLEF